MRLALVNVGGGPPGRRANVHPRLSDIVALVHAVQAKTVIAAYCDRSQLANLAEALAPARVTMDEPIGL